MFENLELIQYMLYSRATHTALKLILSSGYFSTIWVNHQPLLANLSAIGLKL